MNKITIVYAILRLMLNQLIMVQSYREHKVHNIVLYPDKHSWCKTTVIKQVISYPGCNSVEINNKVCVGACFSYSIPQTEPSDPGEVIVPYCDSCQPSETTWLQITLQCNADTSHQLIKNVQIIQNCSCTPCEKNSLRMTKLTHDSDDLSLQTSVDSEILNALHVHKESNASNHVDVGEHWKNVHSLLNREILSTLKNIQVNNTEEDKEKLFELFDVMQEPLYKHKVKTKNIINFIANLSQNVTDLDMELLAEILLKYEKNQKWKIYDTTNDKGPEAEEVGAVNDQDQASSAIEKEEIHDSAISVWMHKESNSKFDQSIENASSDDGLSDLATLQPHSQAHEHRQHKESLENVPVEIAEKDEDRVTVENVTTPDIDVNVQPHHMPHTHQHHHVNDNFAANSHLTRGPHGALVIERDRMHEKLVDINAHELKPNHAGTLLSYRSHSTESDSQK